VSSSLPSASTIGRYEVTRVLGQGAMGRVLLARDPVLSRDVAIKILRDDLGLPPEVCSGLLVRMRHEAQAAARVSHPNIVTLHDMGEDPAVGLFLVFEFVNGPNLKERLRVGRLPPQQAARLARELGNALALAHLSGVLHRDIKPENVMLAPSGAKVSDFGIARIPNSTLTRTGTLLGTPAYCAPEALSTGTFSPESDQFSLAATLYEAVSGERAFPGDDAVGVAAKIQTEEPRPIAPRCGLPDEVDDILLRGMNKTPRLRYASTAEFGETLAACLERREAPAVVAPAPTRRRPRTEAPSGEPRPARMLIGALTIAVVSGLVGYAASQGQPFFATGVQMPRVSASPETPPTRPPPTTPTRPRPTPRGASGGNPAATSTEPAGRPVPSSTPSPGGPVPAPVPSAE
jgi:serine/threonine-protein kinase